MQEAAGLPVAADLGGERVYAVPPGEAGAAVLPAEPVATRWTALGVVADLGAARRVDGLVFELADGPWVAAPRLQRSLDGKAWEDLEATASLADATLLLYLDPRRGRGALRFTPVELRFLQIGPELPLRRGALEIMP